MTQGVDADLGLQERKNETVKASCSLKARCVAFLASSEELPGLNLVRSNTGCRQKTLFVVRHGESEANLEIERRGYAGYMKVLSPAMREKYRDPPLTLEGDYADRLYRLYSTVRKFSVKAQAYLSSPLTRAVQTAIIGFQDELEEGRKLEMLPIVREKKKFMVEFGDKGRIYTGSDPSCPNAGLEHHVNEKLRELSALPSQAGAPLLSTLEMITALRDKLPRIHLQMTANTSSWSAKFLPEDQFDWEQVMTWMNACQEWWDGESADWSETARIKNVASFLGLRHETSFVLVGHSSFWRDYFDHFIDKDRFLYLDFGAESENMKRRALAKLLRRAKLENAAMVKIIMDCVGETGPCDSVVDVESLDTRLQTSDFDVEDQ
jgi:hypothetical protein